jgi:FHA domain/zinc-ribbon domain
MSDRNLANLTDIYTEYVRLRQTGSVMAAAIKTLQPLVDQLDKNQRDQLNLLVRQWEARESNRYLTDSATKSAPSREVIRPLDSSGPGTPIRPLKKIPPPQPPPPTAFGNSAPAGEIFCPNCGKSNAMNSNYCYSCGHILPSARTSGATKDLPGTDMDPRTRWGTAFLTSSTVSLIVQDMKIDVEVPPDREVVLGRSSGDSPMRPDVDLSRFNGEQLGVSRLHASLRRSEETVQIADLSSKNFTYINGQQLHPREVRVLRNDDEIRLGKLTMKVKFSS